MPYHQFRVTLSKEQQSRALRGQAIKITKANLGHGSTILLHPENFKKCNKAKNGVTLNLSPGEIMATANFHGLMPGDLELTGAGFFNNVWEGIKKVGSWIKDSGVGTAVADALVPVAASVLGPTGADVARKVVRGVTGVGAMPARKPARIRRNLQASGLYL